MTTETQIIKEMIFENQQKNKITDVELIGLFLSESDIKTLLKILQKLTQTHIISSKRKGAFNSPYQK